MERICSKIPEITWMAILKIISRMNCFIIGLAISLPVNHGATLLSTKALQIILNIYGENINIAAMMQTDSVRQTSVFTCTLPLKKIRRSFGRNIISVKMFTMQYRMIKEAEYCTCLENMSATKHSLHRLTITSPLTGLALRKSMI